MKLNPSGDVSQHLAWEVTSEGCECPDLRWQKRGGFLPPSTRPTRPQHGTKHGSREKWQGNNPGGGTHVQLLVLPSPTSPQCPSRASPQQWGAGKAPQHPPSDREQASGVTRSTESCRRVSLQVLSGSQAGAAVQNGQGRGGKASSASSVTFSGSICSRVSLNVSPSESLVTWLPSSASGAGASPGPGREAQG